MKPLDISSAGRYSKLDDALRAARKGRAECERSARALRFIEVVLAVLVGVLFAVGFVAGGGR